ncbi:methyl-accepting chemotaxis protein [Asticcacaulis sp. AND118]|uniref:methyl-accepting chemotaxis protein n=1 Tax=Asticcacaulis sp. AND118 TaxID=2840468 RepID=UPI001D00027F|nr:methyl-accepting chemotaxis protein [Asticcacaulis sp. AND118]UDF02448.1 methyl-accepting chemotaxis protein [Asticcacaulis sp. AND118]
MRIKNVPIAFKIVGILAFLAISMIFVGAHYALTFKNINQTYSELATDDYPALVALIRISQRNAYIAQHLFKLESLTCPSAECKAAGEEVTTSVKESNELMQTARNHMHGRDAVLDQLDAARKQITAAAQPAATAYLSGDKAGGRRHVQEVEKGQQAFRKVIRPLIKDVDSTTRTTTTDLQKRTENLLQVGGVVALGLALTAILLSFLGARALIARPILDVCNHMKRMSDGDISEMALDSGRRDEIGRMNGALLIFAEGLRHAETLRAQAAQDKAAAEAQRRQAMLDLADEFERSVGGIVTLVSSAATEMQAAATQLNASAQEATAQSVAVSAAAEEAGASVTSVAASTEELGSSISEISRQVEMSATVAATAAREADDVQSIVRELTDTAASIGGVIELIAGLADQTNLLALNATIESARAGESGKGFAVVASEVKTLAGQTALATTEISAKVAHIQEAAGKAALAMQSITGTISRINNSSTAIATSVEQQGAATQEIVQAVTQASVGTQQVSSNITGVAQAAEQTGGAASQVQRASTELAAQAERLHHEMDRFLSNVRAA